MPGDGPRDFEPPAPPDPNDLLGGRSKWPKLVFILACGLLIGIGLLYFVNYVRPPLCPHVAVRGYTVSCGYEISVSEPVLAHLTTGDVPSGTFRLDGPKLGGLDSNLTGGACMAGDIASLLVDTDTDRITDGIVTGNCSSDVECNPSVAPGHVQKYYGYCVPEGGQLPGRCWYKPLNPEYTGPTAPTESETLVCQKSLYYNPNGTRNDPATRTAPYLAWSVGADIGVPTDQRFDVHAFYRDHTAGRPAKWLLVGCLNGKTPACSDPTGKNTDKREIYGNAVMIP